MLVGYDSHGLSDVWSALKHINCTDHLTTNWDRLSRVICRNSGEIPTKKLLGISAISQSACLGAIILVAIWAFTADSAVAVPDMSGICLGMNRSDVKDILEKNRVSTIETSNGFRSENYPPLAGDGIRNVEFLFQNDLLYKVAVFFQIPEREPNAANLLSLYGRQKNRLTAQYGSPSTCIDEMSVPAPEQLHTWIARGRAYQQCAWEIVDQARISLWLYGEDSGIVLSTVYETLKK
jgi:hypothetical protein